MRSLVPTTRNPAARCRAKVAVFSGKTLLWMVQIPAASGGGVDVDRMLDAPGVDAAAGYRGRGHPAGHVTRRYRHEPVPGQPGRAERVPLRCAGLERGVALVHPGLVD